MGADVSAEVDAELASLRACEERIGYEFRDKGLLRAALTHASGAMHRLASNERMEFLGDAILGAVVCEMLYRAFPDYLEGDLTRLKSIVVSRQTCARISQALGLKDFLILGKGMSSTPTVPSSLLADVFESLIAAIYLDGGHAAVRPFIERWLEPEIEAAAEGDVGGNYKSLLQQVAQREHGVTPTYQLLAASGPDHDRRYECAVIHAGAELGRGQGRSIKEAETAAAIVALQRLEGEATPNAEKDA